MVEPIIGTQNPTRYAANLRANTTFVPFALLSIALPWAIWSVFALLRAGASQLVPFAAAQGSFVILAFGYLTLHGLRGVGWASVSALLTIEALIGFIAVPAWQFATGNDQVNPGYTHSMFLVLIGFTAFWIASLLFKRPSRLSFVSQFPGTSSRLEIVCLAMLILGAAADFVLWNTGLFSYAADAELLEANQGIMQWLNLGPSLLNDALIVSAIEVLGKQPGKQLMRFVFWGSLTSSLLFGVIAGMKSAILSPMMYLMLVYGITHRRLPRTALLLPVFLVLIVYPFVSAYRANLNSGYRAQANTAGGMESTVLKSFDDAFLSFGSRSTGRGAAYTDEALRRLNYLSFVRDVIGLPAPSLLNGDEKLWMSPIYPLVPRALWKNKPVLDKGSRLSVALGGDRLTSDALTPIGDLYSLYGTYGVVIGMFIYGICLQQYMNWAGGRLSERGLFVYASLLLPLLDFESDFVATVGGFIHAGIVVVLTSYLIYGRSAGRSSGAYAHVR